jgi:hypothetical protein
MALVPLGPTNRIGLPLATDEVAKTTEEPLNRLVIPRDNTNTHLLCVLTADATPAETHNRTRPTDDRTCDQITLYQAVQIVN